MARAFFDFRRTATCDLIETMPSGSTPKGSVMTATTSEEARDE
jgi:hypothetical protein